MTPTRQCIGCGARRPPDELVRVVRSAEGSLEVGRTLPGRGAWLCAGSVECVDRAIRRDAFTRALRGPVARTAAEVVRASMNNDRTG